MKTYLEIKVPIKYDDSWLEMLRSHFNGLPVGWQKGYYHITMAFINDTPKGINLRPLLEKQLTGARPTVINFDRLDAFSIKPGRFIIHLTTTHIPECFLSLTKSIRSEMKAVGCVIQSDFMMHVTLGRLNSFDVELSDIKEIINVIPPPSFTLTLKDLEYRALRGRTIYTKSLESI